MSVNPGGEGLGLVIQSIIGDLTRASRVQPGLGEGRGDYVLVVGYCRILSNTC